MRPEDERWDVEWNPVMEEIWDGMVVCGDEREWRRDAVLPFLVETGDRAIWIMKNESMDDVLQSLKSVSVASQQRRAIQNLLHA